MRVLLHVVQGEQSGYSPGQATVEVFTVPNETTVLLSKGALLCAHKWSNSEGCHTVDKCTISHLYSTNFQGQILCLPANWFIVLKCRPGTLIMPQVE